MMKRKRPTPSRTSSPTPFDTLIIDGYSLLHRDPDAHTLLNRNIGLARQLLVRRIERIVPALAAETIVVFDGRGGGAGEAFDTPLSIVFAPAQHTADTVIERMVHAHAAPHRILVVSSDRMERQTVEAAGAETQSCGDFLLREHTGNTRPLQRDQSRGATLGDFF